MPLGRYFYYFCLNNILWVRRFWLTNKKCYSDNYELSNGSVYLGLFTIKVFFLFLTIKLGKNEKKNTIPVL